MQIITCDECNDTVFHSLDEKRFKPYKENIDGSGLVYCDECFDKGQEPPVITGDKDTDELLEIERCNQEDKPWEMGTDQEGILMLDCEHKNKPIYQPEEKDTGIPESYTCDDCGKEFDIPEPDFDLMNKE